MIVEHAKGVLTIIEPSSDNLSEIIVPSCNTCELKERCPIKLSLTNRINPIVKGCSLAWGLREKPIPRPVKVKELVYYTDYTHLTSIASHEVERLLLFDFILLNDERYIVSMED